jgi:hypothetical protein
LAIVSISRIQIRRGRKNAGSGLPQLAGGELGWAVDTQELYIGNGAVSEGAPAVGNSKILTEHDNLFELSDQYTYRNGSNIQTGTTSATPIRRSLQSRLDDEVSVRSFGAEGDGTDQTEALQRAVDQLFLPWSSSQDADNYKKRIILKLHAGLYTISNSIKLPPYVNLIGDGSGKTVIKQTGAFPVLETINGEGIASQTTSLNQANNINLKGLTLESNSTHPGLKLSSCKNSSFTDLHIKGPWVQSQGATIESTQVGILMEATSTPVTTKDNTFHKLIVTGFSYAVLSNDDVQHNVFDSAVIEGCGYGIVFGRDTVLGLAGQATGPINNKVSNSKFSDINLQGIWIKHGFGNISDSNIFNKVGNDAGLETAPAHSVIKFESNKNATSNDFFSRTSAMIRNFAGNIPYLAEVEGPHSGTSAFTTKFGIKQLSNEDFIKLPADTSKTIHINYLYKMQSDTGFRKGTLQIMIDKDNNTSHISDTYDHQGNNAEVLTFSTQLFDYDADSDFETLVITATNNDDADVTLEIQNIS